MIDAGGSSALGQQIPVPMVRTETLSWAQKSWASSSTIWPTIPPKVAPLTVATHVLFALFLVVALVGASTYFFEYLATSATELNRQLVVGVIAAQLVIAVAAVTMARFNLAVGAARLFFLFFVVSAVLAAITTVLAIVFDPELAFAFSTIPQLANLPSLVVAAVFVALSIVVWVKITDQVSSFTRWRSTVLTAMGAVFPHGQRERHFASAPVMVDANSGELERRLAVAERLTAPLLEQLIRMPAVTVVQGLEVPGSRTAHVGHAVVAGNQVAFIDSLLWAPGEYALDAWGRVVRDGKIDEHINVTTAIAEQRLAADRPQLVTKSWAVVHRLADAPLTIACEPNNAVRLVTPEELLREVGEWLAPVGEQLDVFALQFAVNSRLK
ncbi:hypothetical protein [Salinibacterium sp. SWN1162]|uniref:hypothetical protein n=1 Tax=Salinibacterium sp. SWN1162 TaxID=2792053 RepID=UPI0018CCB799|nr:hypothetical protein [Salinibacterium sp. SWN1162]MBH0008272.1 hypothetical protein [Salinibacterium sp. SWN1162]